MINFDDAPRRSRGKDLPPRPDDAPDATEEQARNLWKLLVEGSLKGHRLRVGNTLRRGGQRGSAGSNAEFEFVEGQVPVSTGSGRRRSSFDPRRYNLKIVADAMRGEKARAIALDNLRFVMDETTGKLYLPWATKEGEARSHNAIPRDLRRYAKDALYTTSGGNIGVRHFYPPGYGPLDDEDAPESRQPKAPVSELRGERGKKRLQDWWDAGGGTPGVTARLRDFAEPFAARVAFGEAEEKRSLFITFELPDYLAEKYPSRAKATNGVKATDDSKPHVTILYCGKQTAAAAEKARKATVEVLKDADSIEIQGSGVDHFTGCEDEGKTDAVYTPITGGVTKLTELREKLAKALRDAGVEWTDTHPEYKPHVTIKYVPKGDADTVDPIEPWTAYVHCLHVNHGDSHRPVYLKQMFKVPFSESASGGQQFSILRPAEHAMPGEPTDDDVDQSARRAYLRKIKHINREGLSGRLEMLPDRAPWNPHEAWNRSHAVGRRPRFTPDQLRERLMQMRSFVPPKRDVVHPAPSYIDPKHDQYDQDLLDENPTPGHYRVRGVDAFEMGPPWIVNGVEVDQDPHHIDSYYDMVAEDTGEDANPNDELPPEVYDHESDVEADVPSNPIEESGIDTHLGRLQRRTHATQIGKYIPPRTVISHPWEEPWKPTMGSAGHLYGHASQMVVPHTDEAAKAEREWSWANRPNNPPDMNTGHSQLIAQQIAKNLGTRAKARRVPQWDDNPYTEDQRVKPRRESTNNPWDRPGFTFSRHPQQAFGIRSIPPTASAYLDRLRQWRTHGSDVEPPDMGEYGERKKGDFDGVDLSLPLSKLMPQIAKIPGHPLHRDPNFRTYQRTRALRVPWGGLDYDPSEMSDRVPTDAEKREIVGPNVWDERMVRGGLLNGKPLAATGSLLQDYELERYEAPTPKQGKRGPNPFLAGLNLGVPHGMLERHNLRYPNHPAQQEASVNVPGSATDLRTRLLEMELNDPSVPHRALYLSQHYTPNTNDIFNKSASLAQDDIIKALNERNDYASMAQADAKANSTHGGNLLDTIRRNISRHRFARQPQQFGRSMGYAVDVPEQAFARETHPMLQMAIDRSLQRPHRSSMPPEIGHPRSPLEYTGAGPVVVRSAPQDLTPEAFGPGNHIVTGEMPVPRRRPNFQPIREPRFNPDAAHDEVIRMMLGRLPRPRYQGKPGEPLIVRANDEWNSDPTTFQRYQQAFAVDDDPNSPRRVWQTPPVVNPQAPQKPATPSKPEGQDIQNARVLARHYARPAIQPSTPKEPGFGKPSARQGEGLSEDWIKNFVKRGDDQSNEFAPPWMRGAGYDAPWNRGRGPENIGENLFPAPTPRMIDDRQPSLAPYRSGSRLDGGYLPRVRSVVNRTALGGQPRSLSGGLGGALRGAWRGGTSGLGTSLGNIGLGLAGTLLGLGTQNLGTIGHGLLGIGSGALGIAGTPLRAVGGAGLGAAGYDPASWSTKRWGYKPWQVQQRQPEDDQEAPWANAPERKFSRQSQQGFSILRPDETGKGRGLGSAYPRVSTGRYGETNVEYDPTIAARQGENRDQRWLETRSIGGKIHRHPYNPAEDVSDNSGEQIDNYWETGFNKYPHMVAKHVAENLPTDTAGALLRAELRNPSRGVSRSDIQGRLIKLAPRMRISENRRDDLGDVIESNGGLREFIRSSPIVEMIGEWLRDVNHGEGNPLSAAGIQRPGRGPGRGGGPRFSRHDHEFAAPGGAPNRVMFPSDDGSAQPGQYANAGLQTQQMRSVFGPQSSLQTTRPPFTQAAQAGGTILVTPTGGIMGVVVPPRTVPVSPTTMQPIRPQPSTRWEKPRQFARHDHEFSASGVAGQFAPNVPAMPRMNRQTFNPQPPQQEPIVDWLQALRGTGAPRPMPQQQIQRPRPKPRPSAAEEFWPRVMPFARRPQQGFSILRPYETSGGGKFPGRGIGSPYPRIVNGNVEYDPTIRPIEAGNIERNGDELRITRPQNEKRISVPVGAQIRNGITYFDPSDRIEGTPTDIQIEGAPWRPETARIYDDGGDGGEIEQLDPRRDRETDDSALRELYEWRRKARLRANQQPKSLWAGEQLPQSLDGDRVETYRKRENELSMGPEDSATGEMLRSLAKLENRKFIVNNDGFTIPHPEGDADTHPLGKAGIIQRPRHWKLGRSRLDQSPLSQEQLKVLHGFNPMYLSADVAVGDPEWRRLANIASSTYRPRTKGALDDRHYVQYGRMPSAEQDFSILRPDETGKGRGLGSMYPRVSTGRYGETNVEYDPSVRPIERETSPVDWDARHNEVLDIYDQGDRRLAEKLMLNWRGELPHIAPAEPHDDFDVKQALAYQINEPLEHAGIRRPGRGPGRGGGPRFMAQHSFSIGASAPSATTLNHFHPSIRRSTKRRMFEVC